MRRIKPLQRLDRVGDCAVKKRICRVCRAAGAASRVEVVNSLHPLRCCYGLPALPALLLSLLLSLLLQCRSLLALRRPLTISRAGPQSQRYVDAAAR